MESTNLDLKLNCLLSKDTKAETYIIVTLFHGSTSNYERHRADLDTKGNASLHLKGVNVESAFFRFQVFNHRKFLFDKHIGKVNVLVSELVSSSAIGDRKINHEASATYEIVKSSKKRKKGDLKLSYKLSMAEPNLAAVVRLVPSYEKPAQESKRVVVPSFRTPFKSLKFEV